MSESDVNASGMPSWGNLLIASRNPEDRSEGTTMDNLIVWADVPVLDLDRAMRFYGAVLAAAVRHDGGHGWGRVARSG